MDIHYPLEINIQWIDGVTNKINLLNHMHNKIFYKPVLQFFYICLLGYFI